MHTHSRFVPLENDTSPAILPAPVSMTYGKGYFSLGRDTVIVTDEQTQAVGMLLADALRPALGFTASVLAEAPATGPTITLDIDLALIHLGPEGYVLQVTPRGVSLRGAGAAGVFYGMQTLRQLLPTDIFSATPLQRDWRIAAVTIEDFPRFPWRGLLLDPVRHFIPKEAIFKFIDLLALHKMNVLHLHLTDDQGWRMEIKKYPRLTEVGAWRMETIVGSLRNPEGYDGRPHGGFYSQDDLREIVAYAAARFVTVLPEIEMPGHAQAAIAAYPELGVLGEPLEVSTTWGIHLSLYNPTERTMSFLKDVLSEVMTIFPGQYIHIGGDEAHKEQWQASLQVQARIKELGLKDEEDLQRWFLTEIGDFLTQYGRRLVGWDEMLEGGLAPGATVMSWRGQSGGILAAQMGHDVVMTSLTHVYFDFAQSNDPAEPLSIGGYTPLDRVYAFDPLPTVLKAEEARHVLGVQGMLWSEYIPTLERLEYMAFPRLLALAEVGWTPPERKDFVNFRQRLARHEERLQHLGVTFRPVTTWEQERSFPPRRDRLVELQEEL